jgi:hypothetical protein
MTSDWWLLVSASAADPRWRQHHFRPGEWVDVRDQRTRQDRRDAVAIANPRFWCNSAGLAFEQPPFVDTSSGPLLRPGVPVLSGPVPRFIIWRAPG